MHCIRVVVLAVSAEKHYKHSEAEAYSVFLGQQQKLRTKFNIVATLLVSVDIFSSFATVLQLMLMMRLQRVGRKNDPSYRIVVTDKRTGPKSNKHIDLLGSYNPKLGHIQIDGEKAKKWLAQGVQPSVTLHNILISQKVIEGKKLNALSKKSPIVDEEAIKKAAEEEAAKVKKAEDEAKAQAEAEEAAKVAAEAPVEEVAEVVAEATEEVAA